MLVERHVSCSLVWPIADLPHWQAPPAVFQKLQAQRQCRAPAGAPMPKAARKGKDVPRFVQPAFGCSSVMEPHWPVCVATFAGAASGPQAFWGVKEYLS